MKKAMFLIIILSVFAVKTAYSTGVSYGKHEAQEGYETLKELGYITECESNSKIVTFNIDEMEGLYAKN